MDAIGPKLLEVGWQANDDQSQVVHLAASFADSGEWAAAGYSSASRWIADKLEVARRTANEWIRVGRCLRALPETADALQGRRISFTKAKELTRSATPGNEADLLAIAERVPASELSKEIARWLNGTESDDVVHARHHDARSLRWQNEADGTIAFFASLPPAQAGVVMAAVDAVVMHQSQQARPADEAWPSLAQQRADALVNAVQAVGIDVSTEIIIHIRSDGATLDDGTPITNSAVSSLLDGAFVRALIHDAGSMPINASGRQRHPTTRQQRVVKERDRECVDCGSNELLQYDHVPDYAETKHTLLDELELRCSTCHRFRHQQAG